MAKRMKSKIQPSQLELYFNIDEGTNYIDISQSVSLANRRFYRQGLNWALAGLTFSRIDPVTSGASQVVVSKLPNTWVMSNAWEKGFRAWQKMNRESLEGTESIKPKFLDFKIYADHQHSQNGSLNNKLPIDSAGIPAKPGEWVYSKYVIPTSSSGNVTDYDVIAVGASFQNFSKEVSLIEGYAASRGLPNISDPNAPSDADDVGPNTNPENWIGALDNDGTNQDRIVLDDMLSENNQAPYPFENGDDPVNGGTYTDTMYPGGANQLKNLMTHDIGYFNPGNHANKIMLSGGNFPCGLIKIQSAAECVVKLSMVPGNHRGYLAESMTEM